MNNILIIDASASDGRIMAGLLTRAGYDPVVTDCIEAGKVEAAKLPPGAVIVTAMRLPDGTTWYTLNLFMQVECVYMIKGGLPRL